MPAQPERPRPRARRLTRVVFMWGLLEVVCGTQPLEHKQPNFHNAAPTVLSNAGGLRTKAAVSTNSGMCAMPPITPAIFRRPPGQKRTRSDKVSLSRLTGEGRGEGRPCGVSPADERRPRRTC